MAQMERSAKKLPANLANRDFKAEAAKAKTPADRDKLLNMRTAKLKAMEKAGDKNASAFAKGDAMQRAAAGVKKNVAESYAKGTAKLKDTQAKQAGVRKAAAAVASNAGAVAGKVMGGLQAMADRAPKKKNHLGRG